MVDAIHLWTGGAAVVAHGLDAGVDATELPLGKGDAGLVVDGGHEGWQHLIDVAHGVEIVAAGAGVARGVGVPDAYLGLEAADGVCVCLGQLDMGAFQKPLGPPKASASLA